MLILKQFATLPLYDFFENLYKLRIFFKLTKNYEKMIKSSNTITKNGNRATGVSEKKCGNGATGVLAKRCQYVATGQRGNATILANADLC